VANGSNNTSLNRWLNAIAADVINQQLRHSRQAPGGAGREAFRQPPGRTRRARLAARWQEAEPSLDLLPAQQREVVALRFRDGLSYRAIAARLSVPLGTVHSRLARGKELLAEQAERSRDRFGAAPLDYIEPGTSAKA